MVSPESLALVQVFFRKCNRTPSTWCINLVTSTTVWTGNWGHKHCRGEHQDAVHAQRCVHRSSISRNYGELSFTFVAFTLLQNCIHLNVYVTFVLTSHQVVFLDFPGHLHDWLKHKTGFLFFTVFPWSFQKKKKHSQQTASFFSVLTGHFCITSCCAWWFTFWYLWCGKVQQGWIRGRILF